MTIDLCNVAQAAPHQRHETKLVVSAHQGLPVGAFVSFDWANPYSLDVYRWD